MILLEPYLFALCTDDRPELANKPECTALALDISTPSKLFSIENTNEFECENGR